MNKDSVILRHQQGTVSDAEKELAELKKSNNDHEIKLAEMRAQLAALGAKPTKKRLISVKRKKEDNKKSQKDEEPVSYELLYETARKSLTERGLDVDNLDYSDLINEEELTKLTNELNCALPREEKWHKSDFIVVFSAAIIGSVMDFILSNRDNPLTGQKSKLSNQLNDTLHEGKHSPNAPIDYQGNNFGGGFHRELSKGHDIARFSEGIRMFKNGSFEGIRYVNGVAHKVVITSNQYGNPYSQLTTIEAIIEYSKHMFADLFSKASLPLPGYSFLAESTSRDARKFAADMYHNGFNCKNVIIQSVSTIAIEIIIRIYCSILSVKNYRDQIEVAEDYSNLEAIKQFIKPANKEKLNEMLLVAHSIVTLFNLGKVIITKNLAEINVTEIISVVRYGLSVVSAMNKRNNEYRKIIYHSDRIDDIWKQLDSAIADDETSFIQTQLETLEIA